MTMLFSSRVAVWTAYQPFIYAARTGSYLLLLHAEAFRRLAKILMPQVLLVGNPEENACPHDDIAPVLVCVVRV